jgi:hypothetical protein
MTITLLDGRTANTDQIAFDPVTYHFTLNSEDVTALISRADKQNNWPNFDPAVDNTRLSNQNQNGVNLPEPDLPTNTGGILVNQLLTDPLAAPLDSIKSEFNKVFATTTGKVIIIGGVVVLGLLLIPRK